MELVTWMAVILSWKCLNQRKLSHHLLCRRLLAKQILKPITNTRSLAFTAKRIEVLTLEFDRPVVVLKHRSFEGKGLLLLHFNLTVVKSQLALVELLVLDRICTLYYWL